MKLSDALYNIAPTRGTTSVVSAILGGDLDSVSGGRYASQSLKEARAQLARYEKAQNEAQSDAAFWGYMGDVSYWQAVVALLEAAEITGPDNLPDIPYQNDAVTVMDVCAKQERWGKQVLDAARAELGKRGEHG